MRPELRFAWSREAPLSASEPAAAAVTARNLALGWLIQHIAQAGLPSSSWLILLLEGGTGTATPVSDHRVVAIARGDTELTQD